MIKYIISSLLFLLIGCQLQAQQTPAPAQSEAIAIRGGTIHIGNGQSLKNGLIIFENGKLNQVTTLDNLPPINWNEYKVIEAEGKHIYPSFIALNTQIGLSEIEAVRATRDDREIGYLKPNIRSIIAYNTDSKVTPTVRSNGILMAQITPVGGRIPGQSSVVELDAWNWEDAAYLTDEGIYLNWPNAFQHSGWWAEPGETKKNEKYTKRVQELEHLFREAQAYAQKEKYDNPNLKLEAMRGLFDGSKNLYIDTDFAKTIMEAVLFAKKYGIKPVLVDASDAWRVADFLKENDIAVILGQTQDLPSREDEDIDQAFKNAKILQEKGVLFALSMDGSWQQRNLIFQAGQAVANGLAYEAAVASISLNAAKILGIEGIVGTLENGKDATFIISEGDVFDMRTSKVQHAFIRGKAIDLDNKQKALARKFTEKYKN